MSSKPNNVQLNTGSWMPLMGFGTLIGNLNPVHDEAVEVIENALQAGYRHFDTAKVYSTEKILGEVLSKHINGGDLKREDVFITTKLGLNCSPQDCVVPGLKAQLADLGLEYVDLYLIHWPVAFKTGPEIIPVGENGKFIYEQVDYLDTWRGMEECYKLGLAKAIGISNFNSKQITRLLENGSVKPAVLQIESHPFFSNDKLVNFCEQRGIKCTAYSPLAGFETKLRDENGWPTIFTDETIKTVAQKHNRSPAQVALRYQIQRKIPVIPKSSTKQRIIENFQALDFELSTEDMSQLRNCDKGYRHCTMFEDQPYFPFAEEF